MYLTIALALWFIHYMYFTRIRKRYTIQLYLSSTELEYEYDLEYEYKSNTLPLEGHIIIAIVNGLKCYYRVRHVVHRLQEPNLFPITVELITKELPDEHTTPNYTRTTVSQQTNHNSSTRERPKGEVDPKQDR